MANPRLRITHVIPQIGIGGTEMQLCRLVMATPAARAEHRILFYSDSLDEQGIDVYTRLGLPFSRVERARGGPLGFLFRLKRAIAAGRPDIVHCWLPSAAFWGRWAATLAGVDRIVLAIRNTLVELPGVLRVSRHLDGRRIRYLVNSTATADAVARVVGVPRARITVIWNGIEPNDDEASPSVREALLESQGCPPGTRVVLSVGRLTEFKNHPMLLRIAGRARGRLPAHFFVAGHGELEETLKDLARQLEVDDLVHFLGLRRDIPALLKAADVFCYTSRSEGMPNSLLEAMAAGCPIVTTRFAGVEEFVEAGRSARVVAPDDDAGAFEALCALIEDRGAATTLGEAARRTVEERFGMKRMVESTLEYYDRIMQGLA
jgi:glycosyltransferase involved in cell wall biosynthesis